MSIIATDSAGDCPTCKHTYAALCMAPEYKAMDSGQQAQFWSPESLGGPCPLWESGESQWEARRT